MQVQEIVPVDVARGIAMSVDEGGLEKRNQQGQGHTRMKQSPHEAQPITPGRR